MESRLIARDGEERTTTRPTPAGVPSCAPAQDSRSFFNPVGAWLEALAAPERARVRSGIARSLHGRADAEGLLMEYASAIGLGPAETCWILEDAAACAEEAATLLRIDAMLDDAAERASGRVLEPLQGDAVAISLAACRLLIDAGHPRPPSKTRSPGSVADEVSTYALI